MADFNARQRLLRFAKRHPELPIDLSSWQDVVVHQKTSQVWSIEVDTGETDTYEADFDKDELQLNDLYASRSETGIGYAPAITIDSPGKRKQQRVEPVSDDFMRRAIEAANAEVSRIGLRLETPRKPITISGRIMQGLKRLVRRIFR